METLKIENITKKFGGLLALKNVSFSVHEKEIKGLIGPNGAGKTTLFKIIMGFEKPDAGSVIFKGEEITGMPPYKINKKGIAMTFQISRPFEGLTVKDNIMIALSAFPQTRLNRKRPEEVIDEILEFVGLSEKMESLARDLTSAERHKLELARALATQPRLLLLDEVMAGLNPAELNNAIRLIRKINEKWGITIIVVEHVLKAVMDLCDSVVVLDSGKKIADGPPLTIAKDEKVISAYIGE